VIHLGDATKWQEWDIDFGSIDIIIAGFPCQSWSLAGKQLGIDDPRGQLVFCMIAILNKIKETNPDVKFLFENVKMKPEHLSFLNDKIGLHQFVSIVSWYRLVCVNDITGLTFLI